MIDFSRKIQTVDGEEVVIVTLEGPAPFYPVVGYIVTKSGEMVITDWTEDGLYMMSGWGHGNNLVNVEEHD